MKSLTKRQQEILNFIRQYIADEGLSPSTREIAQWFGIQPSAVQGHLEALVRKNAIRRSLRIPRSIRVLT